MKVYSQNNEQDVILAYFGQSVGNYMDIGAYHATQFSNTRALYEMGWHGVLIEPAPDLSKALRCEYAGEKRIKVLPVAVTDYNGTIDFYDSQGDAIGSTEKAHVDKWASYADFVKINVPCMTLERVFELGGLAKYDFVNIDTEGNCMQVLQQLNVDNWGVRMICVEHNGQDIAAYRAWAAKNGMNELLFNPENLIFVK
jgi:FkbM family methyltransferase